MKMTTASTDAQWTLGTATGGRFNKSGFNTGSATLAGPNAGDFTITSTVNGFIVDSNAANLPSGYVVSFLIQSNNTLASSTYELTYAEATGSKTSLNNDIYHEVVEDTSPEAHSIQAVPNSRNMTYGGSIYLRANITDNNQVNKTVHVIPAPDIWVSPTGFDFNINTGDVDSDILTVGNENWAETNLYFNVSIIGGNWLSANPASGNVGIGSSTNLNVNVDATSLTEGYYQGYVVIDCNDLDEPVVYIPVNFLF